MPRGINWARLRNDEGRTINIRPDNRNAVNVARNVEATLEKHGLPFELQVGQVIRQEKFFVQHAALYPDPETHKLREIDILATEILRSDGAAPE